jgi:hypothetical protein
LRLSPSLDPEALRPLFARHGRLHVAGVLDDADARRLEAALREEGRYRRAINQGEKAWDLPLDQWDALPQDKRDALTAAAHGAATHGFQFLFDTYRLSDAVEAGQGPGGVLEEAYGFLNSEAFLDWVRRLTGDPRPRFCDAQATRYGAGQFLTTHDDHNDEKGRLYAFVLNLTPGWRADWGGLLLFLDEDGHVAEGYTPAFNALNIFRVPQRHCVSLVAPFAGGPRLSITGWVRH